MRKGFSLLTAIIFLILIATLSALSITLSTQSVKQTTDIYLKTQSELLLRSGTEFAMLAISGHNFNATCLNSLSIRYPENTADYTHDINISISYIGSNLPAGCNQYGTDIATPDSNRTVIIDTVVSTNPTIQNEQIRLHRRTIQKP